MIEVVGAPWKTTLFWSTYVQAVLKINILNIFPHTIFLQAACIYMFQSYSRLSSKVFI